MTISTRAPAPADPPRRTDDAGAWYRRSMPVTTRVVRDLGGTRFPGERLACWLHLVENAVPLLDWIVDTGADVLFGSCDPATADPGVIAHLRRRGATVLAAPGDDRARHQDLLREAVAWRPDLVTEMGGELIAALVRAGSPPSAAMESTTTGIHRIRAAGVPMPVLNWNDIDFKQQVEHRFHVAEALWTSFSALTGMGLLGRRVVVVGYGNVGKGIAAHARSAGAVVTVAEPDPLRRLDASLHGCDVVGHVASAAPRADLVVTASGRDGVLDAETLDRLPDGALVVNGGHAATEIDLGHLAHWTVRTLRPGVVEHTRHDGKRLFVLGHGSPLNLAYPHGSLGDDLWDPFNALMLMGSCWLLDGSWRNEPAGFVEFPLRQQQHLARLMLSGREPARGTVVAVYDIRPTAAGDKHEIREVAGAHVHGTQRDHSLTHCTLQPGAVVPPHARASERTYIVERGSGHVTLDGVGTPLASGQVVVVPPAVVHGLEAGTLGLTYWMICTPSCSSADHLSADD
jgi:adenosylhomocysteinase